MLSVGGWEQYRELDIQFNRDQGAAWVWMKPSPRPCFNPQILQELRDFQEKLRLLNERSTGELPIPYFVGASRIPGVFGLGGDLELFAELIEARDATTLRNYAKCCIDIIYLNAVNFHLPMMTIALVQGDALGGGFEAALSCNVIIAERQARFGLPEILFNLFPGMGAYSLLSRRIGPGRAERLILGGNIHTAEELHAIGIVDLLVEDGGGEHCVDDYIRRHRRRRLGHQGMFRVRQHCNPLAYDDLLGVVDIWVESALCLTKRDLRMMRRLARAQNRVGTVEEEGNLIAAF